MKTKQNKSNLVKSNSFIGCVTSFTPAIIIIIIKNLHNTLKSNNKGINTEKYYMNGESISKNPFSAYLQYTV